MLIAISMKLAGADAKHKDAVKLISSSQCPTRDPDEATVAWLLHWSALTVGLMSD